MKAQAQDLMHIAQKRREQKPAMAQQNKRRSAKSANAGVHEVKRDVHPNRVQEAEALFDDDLPTEKRWTRASSLPGIPAPPGFVVRWVRLHNRTNGDCANLVQYQQEGWKIARKSMFKKKDLPLSHLTRHGEVIGNADTILMIATESLVADRQQHIRDRTDRATRGVHEESGLLKELRPEMPLAEDVRKSTSQFHRMRRRKAEPAPESAGVEE
jgi:hypothetical protein